jgi:hypothetical protein
MQFNNTITTLVSSSFTTIAIQTQFTAVGFFGYRMNATATEDEVAFYFRRYYRWYFY